MMKIIRSREEKTMSEEVKSELDEREPELEEASDYDKPLSSKKRNWIIVAFAIAIIVYLVYSIMLSAL